MATIEELNNWIRNAGDLIEQYRRTIAECNKKIDRLKSVYQRLGEIKREFQNVRKMTEQIFEEKGTWRGEKHSDFVDNGIILDNACGDYYMKLDDAQDEVNRKIGVLKAEIADYEPVIGRLRGQIAQWMVELQNARN